MSNWQALIGTKIGHLTIIEKVGPPEGKRGRRGPYFTKHGHSANRQRSPAYISWQGMKTRCTNPKNPHYKYYGRRGISYDPRWEKFENFLTDMGCPAKGMTLDRIDPKGNYCKENCQWVTQSENTKRRFCSEELR